MMTMTALRPRAVALIYNSAGQILLMLRRKDGRAFATLPGGGIDDGETPAEAAAREVLEEVNLVVRVGKQVAEWDNIRESRSSHEHYFLAEVRSGEMRLGDGPESIRSSEANWYEPQWCDVSELEKLALMPERARDLVREYTPKAE